MPLARDLSNAYAFFCIYSCEFGHAGLFCLEKLNNLFSGKLPLGKLETRGNGKQGDIYGKVVICFHILAKILRLFLLKKILNFRKPVF